MTAVVIPFTTSHPRQRSRGWRPDEIAEVYRVVDLLARAGVSVAIDSGQSDEGEPWLVIMRDDTEDVIVHIARIDGRVIVASAVSERMFSGPTLGEALRRAVGTDVLVLPRGGTSTFFLHPAALLAALIATALTHATAAASTGTADVAEDGGATRAPSAPTGPPAGPDRPHPEELRAQGPGEPSPALGRHESPAYSSAAVATAVATVVISVALTGEDQLNLITREFLQAMAPTAQGMGDAEQHEERAAQSSQAQVDLVSAPPLVAGVSMYHDAPDGDATLPPTVADGLDVAPATAHADGFRPEFLPWLDELPSFKLAGHQEALPTEPRDRLHGGWDSAQVTTSHLEGTELGQAVAPAEQQGVISLSTALAPVTSPAQAASTAAPPAQSVAGTAAAPSGSSAGLHSATHDPDMLEFSHFSLFREGAQLLGVFKFDDLHLHADREPGEENAGSPGPDTARGSAAPGDAMSMTLPQPALPEVVPYEASPETKAAALTKFAYGDAHEVHVSHATLEAIRAQVTANSFLPNVDRVIIFDTPHPNADQFMLMPGVAMVRSESAAELLSHLAAQPVDFTLSDGATLRLLGMIDL
jgi:hypothetical protein